MEYAEDASIRKRHSQVGQSRTFRNVRNILSLGTKRVLDVGCGYGEYLTHFGPHSVGITTTSSEVEYGTRSGIAIRLGNAEFLEEAKFDEPFTAVWANNLFEHLLSPHAFLVKLKSHVSTKGVLVLGVPVIPVVPLLIRLRKFRGALASNHIGFYTRNTLRLTVERAGWTVTAVRPFLFTNAFLDALVAPIAPHVYVVAQNDTAFVYPEKKVKEWEGDARYADLLSLGR